MYIPVFNERLKVQREAHAERQKRRVFLQYFGQNLKVRLTVLIWELPRGQLHLHDRRNKEKALESLQTTTFVKISEDVLFINSGTSFKMMPKEWADKSHAVY